MFAYATIPAESDAAHAATLTICRGLFHDDFPTAATLRARQRRWVRQAKTVATVMDVFCQFGDGLRAEELAAATGLPEAAVWRVLRGERKLGFLVDLGERGWYRVSEAIKAGLVKGEA